MQTPPIFITLPKSNILSQRLRIAAKQLLEFDQAPRAQLHSSKVGEALASIVLSTRYRRSSLVSSSAVTIKRYLDKCVNEQTPIELYVMVGGYKQARLPFAPGIDWAEFFNIRYIYSLAIELAHIHTPGVRITYRFHTVLLARINNYRLADFDLYKEQFSQVLTYIAALVPSGVRIQARVVDSNSRQEENEVYARVYGGYAQFEQQFNGQEASVQDRLLEKSWRNIAWDGAEDWTTLDHAQKIAKARHALFLDQAFLAADPITSAPVHDDKITIYSRTGVIRDRLQYGGCSASSVQFWAGTGVLEVRPDKVIPQILSYSQLIQRPVYTVWPDTCQNLGIPPFLTDKLQFTLTEAS
jgi:hypothetical protein